ncbi:MAG: hypothetical protein MUP85_06590 [Candidatus Lokiarchaeota archaeon]|nr:hypothetical protein [Candidatus Lokiarchaeota archaeon]
MNDSEIKFEDIGIDEKIILMDILGYEVDDNGLVLEKETENEYKCPISGEPVFIENASILPGSTVIINTSDFSLSEYFTRFVDKITQ